ncbi:MAG: cupredoxin domain-containing protein [Candidatus Nitrosopumilus sp. bin_32a]
MDSKILLISLFLVLIFIFGPTTVHGETWRVQIPAGSAEIDAPAHYLPSEISVRPGDKVEWGNADSVDHTITSGTLELGLTGIFDSGFMGPGGKYTVTFDERNIGEIKYFCKIHPWMFGIVNVINLDTGFQIFHNVGSGVSESPIDLAYKVERNLVNVDVDTVRNSLTFNFVGKINNDEFTVVLLESLIKNPQSVWINDKQTTNYELTKINDLTTLTMTLGDHVRQVKVVGTDVIGTSITKEHVLANQIHGITDKKFYESGDEIIISGIVQNSMQLYEISLDVVSPKGVTVYHKDLQLSDSAKFTETVPTTGTLRDFGEYDVKITAPSAKSLFLSFEYGIEPNEFQSPLKQMRSGTDSSDVICNEGLELFNKVSNGKAVCLTESTAIILLQRGFVDYF